VLFRPGARFQGLPRESFDVFAVRNHDERRQEIVNAIHPSLGLLGQDLLDALNPRAERPLHAHLPRLDWPRGYRPFCTWLALSHETHGYQAGAQLNVGVHPDHVSIRLGWDTSADAFGRFEFLARHGALGRELLRAAAEADLALRVYAAADWPQGSTCCFHSTDDPPGSFDEVARRGVWWEIGRRHEIPAEMDLVCSAELGGEAAEILGRLLPLYERIEAG
jgi:hypothetical protein